MSGPVPTRSQFRPTVTVAVDPWSANPLLDDAEQAMPETVAAARASQGEPPTMFDSGDLPPFVASGIDPANLRLLPWQTRHAAAVQPSASVVLGWLEQYGHDDIGPDMSNQFGVPGRAEYVGRMRDWLAGKWTNPNFTGPDAEQVTAADNALYDAMFGPQEAALAAKLQAVAAANPPRSTFGSAGRTQ